MARTSDTPRGGARANRATPRYTRHCARARRAARPQPYARAGAAAKMWPGAVEFFRMVVHVGYCQSRIAARTLSVTHVLISLHTNVAATVTRD